MVMYVYELTVYDCFLGGRTVIARNYTLPLKNQRAGRLLNEKWSQQKASDLHSLVLDNLLPPHPVSQLEDTYLRNQP